MEKNKCDKFSYAKELKENNWMIMDIEYIQTSKEHQCVRKIYMLAKNGSTESELEFYPCVRYKDLKAKYRHTFHYCQKYIHKLTYNPQTYSPLCTNVLEEINNFIVYNGIELVLYKGGIIERDLCIDLDIPSINLELIPNLKTVKSHDPRVEVNWYYAQLVGHSYL